MATINTGLDNKRIAINMFFGIVVFAFNLFISFFITPYITSTLGSEAYGFVKLANDFTSYASLATIALNSMAIRFIMLEREKTNFKSAIEYYSSIELANIVLTVILIIPATICIIFLNSIINIPIELLTEVRLTFAITFLSFLLSLAFSIYGNCFYLTNRLDISSICSAGASIIRIVVILLLYFLFTPRISYLAIGSLFSTIFSLLINWYYHKKLTPDLILNKHAIVKNKVWEVFKSGIWNSITKLSQIFSSGLDLLVSNLLLGATNMGYLSIAKTVPNIITSFNSTLASTFSPNMMSLYARGNINQLKTASKSAMKFMCLFVTIPNAILITMGQEFFTLWVPEQPAQLINILSILIVINSCITGALQPLYQIFTITNKIKQSSIVMIIYGFSSILVTVVCLHITDWGLYAVAGVSLVGSVIVALCYHLPFSAIYIGLPWYTFFPEILKGIISLAVQCLVGGTVNFFLVLESSWISWFSGAVLSAIIGLILNALLILNADERKVLISTVISKIKRR